MEQMIKSSYSCDIKQLQATFSSQLNKEKHSVMGGRWLSQHCHVTDQLLWEGQREALPAWAATGAHKTGFTAQHNFPNATFSPRHSTLWWVTDPSPFSWEQQSSPPFGSPSAAADSSARLPGQGTQRRQSRGTAPYAHLARQLQLCFQLHCYKSVVVMYSWKLARFFQL